MSASFSPIIDQSRVKESDRVFLGGLGDPPSGENFANPHYPTLVSVLDQGLPSPPPVEVRPQKFEKSKYIFVSNLTTFKPKSTFKSCISCLK